jgi:hypothetical protein
MQSVPITTEVVSSNPLRWGILDTTIYRSHYPMVYALNKVLQLPKFRRGSLLSRHLCNQCLSPLKLCVRTPLRWGILDTTLCDTVCQWLAAGQWFSPGTQVSSTNKTDRHDTCIKDNNFKHKLGTIQYSLGFISTLTEYLIRQRGHILLPLMNDDSITTVFCLPYIHYYFWCGSWL